MKSERPLTGSLQPKNDKYYAVINEYVGGVRKQNWVYTGFGQTAETRERQRNFLIRSFLKGPRNAEGRPD